MIWGGCKNPVVVGLNLSISSLFVHVHSLCYSTSIKRSGRVPLCSQTLPGTTASCSGLPQLPALDWGLGTGDWGHYNYKQYQKVMSIKMGLMMAAAPCCVLSSILDLLRVELIFHQRVRVLVQVYSYNITTSTSTNNQVI